MKNLRVQIKTKDGLAVTAFIQIDDYIHPETTCLPHNPDFWLEKGDQISILEIYEEAK